MAFAELKARQSVMWGNGPYERVSGSLADMHELVVDRLEPGSGVEWLDAGCGPGNLCFLAAERGANVTGMDLAPVLVERAKELARERGLDIDFDVGDAEEMRYDDWSFDVVSSTIGVMFAPDHVAVARELARVTRPGGRLGLAAWTPDGGIGHLFAMLRPFSPPPPEGVGKPLEWGREEYVRELLGDDFELEFESHDTVMRIDSGEECWDLFSTSFGPAKTAAEALDPDRREELRRTWIEFFEKQREGDEIVHHREFLLTLGTRR